MGCDIHLFVERREGGTWFNADTWTPNPYHEKYPDDEQPLEIKYEDRFYTGRNYDLFAILANVRNGYGFAGVKTGAGFNPIAPPRGLPADVSSEVRGEADRWGADGHSHSWFTVNELLAYDWDQVTQHQGIVDAANYMVWKYEGKPRAWAGGVEGSGVKHLSNDEMEKVITGGFTDHCYTEVIWTEPYRKSAQGFLEKALPKLQTLGPADDVRIVFWFDN